MNINNFIGGSLIFLGLVFLSIALYSLGINSIVKKANEKSPEVKFRYKRLVRDVFYSSIFNTSNILSLYIIVAFLLLVLAFLKIDAEDGNFIISISSIFSSLLILITLIMTNSQNRKNNDNFEKAQKESKEQFCREREETQAQFIEQQKFLQKQKFESTFFNMMNQLENIVSKLSLKYTIERKIRPPLFPIKVKYSNIPQPDEYERTTTQVVGRDVFEHLYKDKETLMSGDSLSFLSNYIKSVKGEDISETDKYIKISLALRALRGETVDRIYDGNVFNRLTLEERINTFGISEYERDNSIIILDHYFRYLYRIMKFVDESNYLDNGDSIENRYNYTCILRATLSPYELVFLFYNGLIYNNLKTLIEKYSLLNNLRPELTAKSIRDYDMNYIESPEYDYYNYISGLEESVKIDYKIEKYQSYAVEKKDNPYLKK